MRELPDYLRPVPGPEGAVAKITGKEGLKFTGPKQRERRTAPPA